MSILLLLATADDVTGTGDFTMGEFALAGTGGEPTQAAGDFEMGAFRMAGTGTVTDLSSGEVIADSGVQVRVVTESGLLVNLLGGVNLSRRVKGLNGEESLEGSISTLHPDAVDIDLFGHEIQLWLDGELDFWGRPTRVDSVRSAQTDETTFRLDGLFSYFYDVVVGGELPNHITSPHEDTAAVGDPPDAWSVTGNIDAAAIVDNNAGFWQATKSIQLNNGEADEDAYAYQRFTVPAELHGVTFAAAGTIYIAGNPDEPVYSGWTGPASDRRGLMIHRLDGATLAPLSDPQVASITEETPRDTVVRLQTPEVLAMAGDVIEVRLYAPAAWTVWQFVWLRDGRAVLADRVDKSEAVQALVEHAQDTTIGKEDHSIGVDLVDLGQVITKDWPWFRRDVVGEQLVDLAETFEFTMDYDASVIPAVRNVKVREAIGSDLTATVQLTKEDLTSWGLGMSLSTTAMRVIRQGEGSGPARDEWWADDAAALGGAVREVLVFGTAGESWSQLRDAAEGQLERMKGKPQLPRATVKGELALTIQPGDTIALNLDHGRAQFQGNARVMKVDLDIAARVATLDLEPV